VCTKYRMSLAHSRAVTNPINLSVKVKKTSKAAFERYVTWIYTSSLHDTIENRGKEEDAHSLVERDILKLAQLFKDQMFVSQFLYARLMDNEDACRWINEKRDISSDVAMAQKCLRKFIDIANLSAEHSCKNVISVCCKKILDSSKFLSTGYAVLDKANVNVLRTFFNVANTCSGSQSFFLSDSNISTEILFFMRCCLLIGSYEENMHAVFETIVRSIEFNSDDKKETAKSCLALLLVASPDFKNIFTSQVRSLTTIAVRRLYHISGVFEDSRFNPFEFFDPKDVERVKAGLRMMMTIPGDGLLTWSSGKCSPPGSDDWEQGKCVICQKEFRGLSRPRLCACCQRNTCKSKCSVKVSPTSEGKAKGVQSQYVCVSCANIALLAYSDLLSK